MTWCSLFFSSDFAHSECDLSILKSEQRILESLPTPLRNFLEKNKHRRFLKLAEKDYKQFSDALHRSLSSPENHYAAMELADSFRAKIRVTKTSAHGLDIRIGYIQHLGTIFGTSPKYQIYDFPKLMNAIFRWLAENRAATGVEEVRIIGENLVNKPLVGSLRRMGFAKRLLTRETCPYSLALGTILATSAGAAGTIVYNLLDVSEESASVLKTAGTLGGATFLGILIIDCVVGKVGYDYSIRARIQ